MGVSRRSYAAQRGVSEAAVRKAIATGRVAKLPDGTIKSVRADIPATDATMRQSGFVVGRKQFSSAELISIQ